MKREPLKTTPPDRKRAQILQLLTSFGIVPDFPEGRDKHEVHLRGLMIGVMISWNLRRSRDPELRISLSELDIASLSVHIKYHSSWAFNTAFELIPPDDWDGVESGSDQETDERIRFRRKDNEKYIERTSNVMELGINRWAEENTPFLFSIKSRFKRPDLIKNDGQVLSAIRTILEALRTQRLI